MSLSFNQLSVGLINKPTYLHFHLIDINERNDPLLLPYTSHLPSEQAFPPHTAGLQLYPPFEGQLHEHTAAKTGRNTVVPERRVALRQEKKKNNTDAYFR